MSASNKVTTLPVEIRSIVDANMARPDQRATQQRAAQITREVVDALRRRGMLTDAELYRGEDPAMTDFRHEDLQPYVDEINAAVRDLAAATETDPDVLRARANMPPHDPADCSHCAEWVARKDPAWRPDLPLERSRP